MEASKDILRMRSVYDLVDYLHANPHVEYITVKTGLRFWGGFSSRVNNKEDAEESLEVLQMLKDALRSHNNIIRLEFMGPSQASLKDIMYILKGIYTSKKFQVLILPIIPIELYKDTTKRSESMKNITHYMYKSKSLLECRIMNGTNNPDDGYLYSGSHLDSKQTIHFQKVIRSILQTSIYKRIRDSRL